MAVSRVRSFQSFGIIPAAGRSRRMGLPKLTMPWGSTTVIEQVLGAWQRSGVDHLVAVVRGDAGELARYCDQAGAIVVSPATPPAEMKDSILAALDAIAVQFQPRSDAVWLLAPADMPRLSSAVIGTILDAHRPAEPAILVPTLTPRTGTREGANPRVQRGHPVLFPWSLAQEVAGLGEDQGVNVLLQRAKVREIAVNEPSILDDLDSPDDYHHLSANWASVERCKRAAD